MQKRKGIVEANEVSPTLRTSEAGLFNPGGMLINN